MKLSEAEEIFHKALELGATEARSAFLDGVCRGRPDLRAQVEKLLAAHQAATGFLDTMPDGSRTIAEPVEETVGSRIGR